MKKADELKILAMCYWRFTRGCPIVSMEYDYGNADVMAVHKDGFTVETEVKVSIRDLKRDKAKSKHWAFEREFAFARGEESEDPLIWGATRAHYFYFAVPEDLKEKALAVVDELFPYAGLLIVQPVDPSDSPSYNVPVYAYKNGFFFSQKPRLDDKQLLKVARHMSKSLCRIGVELILKGG